MQGDYIRPFCMLNKANRGCSNTLFYLANAVTAVVSVVTFGTIIPAISQFWCAVQVIFLGQNPCFYAISQLQYFTSQPNRKSGGQSLYLT